MAPLKDHYKTLGVGENATADEIKKAYRKLAKRYHPDVTGGDKAKEAKFKELSEAYETLGDDKKRTEYDALRKNPFAGHGGAGFPGGYPGGFPGTRGARRGGASRVDINDINDLFAARGPGGGGGGGAGSGGFYDMFSDLFRGGGAAEGTSPGEGPARRSARGEDVRSKVEVDLAVAALGGELPITVDGKRLTVKVPPGIDQGQTIRLAGHGQSGPAGTGDLLLDVQVRPHPTFRRQGDDLEVDAKVPVELAILGGKVEVPTLEGSVKITVPPGSSSGLKLRLRGKGARKRTGPTGERGDLYAVIMITVPREVPERARQLIEEFGRMTREP